MNNRSIAWADLTGAAWVVVVTAVFLGLPLGLPETGVWGLEKIYAVGLIVGVVWMARRVTAASVGQKGAKRRD